MIREEHKVEKVRKTHISADGGGGEGGGLYRRNLMYTFFGVEHCNRNLLFGS